VVYVKGKNVKASQPKKPRKHKNTPEKPAVEQPKTPLYKCNNENGRCGLLVGFRENPPINPICFCGSSVTLLVEEKPDDQIEQSNAAVDQSS
jgi:hypothetical protein